MHNADFTIILGCVEVQNKVAVGTVFKMQNVKPKSSSRMGWYTGHVLLSDME